jgi:hypothetical protein
MKYNINLIRGCMRLTTIITATLALATSAFGELYETPAQFESGRPTNVRKFSKGVVGMSWQGRAITHVGVFAAGRCVIESFSFRDGRVMTRSDVGRFMQPYLRAGMTRSEMSTDGVNRYTFLVTADGRNCGVIIYDDSTNTLSVMTLQAWTQIFKADADARTQAYLNRKQQQNGMQPGNDFDRNDRRTMPKAQPPPPATDKKNDCLIVATEAYARLKKTSYWAIIGGFTVSQLDNTLIGGHAAVFYQPTTGSNVWAYDRSGSLDLFTQSHDVSDILSAYNARLRSIGADAQISDLAWIDGNGNAKSAAPKTAQTDNSSKELIDQANKNYEERKRHNEEAQAQKNAMPAATPQVHSSVTYSTPKLDAQIKKGNEDTLQIIAGLFIMLAVFSGYVSVVTICFMKGKQVFGTLGILSLLFGGLSLWAVIGAIRIAKPHSYWARKYYGPEKMKIALTRFTSLYKESTRKSIEQSIQTIDITRKVQAQAV